VWQFRRRKQTAGRAQKKEKLNGHRSVKGLLDETQRKGHAPEQASENPSAGGSKKKEKGSGKGILPGLGVRGFPLRDR